MINKVRLLGCLVLAVCSMNLAFAQRQMPGAGTSPIKVGSELADVKAFDADGKEFPLREKLKGKHAVLVFGCLT